VCCEGILGVARAATPATLSVAKDQNLAVLAAQRKHAQLSKSSSDDADNSVITGAPTCGSTAVPAA
jgi:hypothetical protein